MHRHQSPGGRPGRYIASTMREDGLATLLPGLGNEAIALGVARWKFAGYGKRPVNHVGRDLLFGSLAREYRAWPYRELRRQPPDWAAPAFEPAWSDTSDTPRRVLNDHVALRLVHELSLARLVDEGGSRMTQEHHDVINDLYACRPVGLAMAWHEHDGRRHDYLCWRNRQCPWCHCRKVVRLYLKLVAGACDPREGRNKLLVMAKIRVEEDQVESDTLTPALVARASDRWKPELLQFGRRLGMVGGMLSHQVGPFVAAGSGAIASFRHEISLLAEGRCEVGGKWSQAGFDRVGELAGFGGTASPQPFLSVEAGNRAIPVEVTAMPMASRMATRWLLAGSAGHPMWGDPSRVTIGRNAGSRTHEGNHAAYQGVGVDGALALQPTFLYTFQQFFGAVGDLAPPPVRAGRDLGGRGVRRHRRRGRPAGGPSGGGAWPGGAESSARRGRGRSRRRPSPGRRPAVRRACGRARTSAGPRSLRTPPGRGGSGGPQAADRGAARGAAQSAGLRLIVTHRMSPNGLSLWEGSLFLFGGAAPVGAGRLRLRFR